MSDLIDRQAVIESIRECAETAHDNYEWDMEQGYLNAIECVEEEPSAQPERKKGRWIDMDDHVMCSCCGAAHYGADKNFCPNCGADMRGTEND